jgi:hypothetical protein
MSSGAIQNRLKVYSAPHLDDDYINVERYMSPVTIGTFCPAYYTLIISVL